MVNKNDPKKNTLSTGVGLEDNRVKEGYALGTPLKDIINIPKNSTKQAQLMSSQSTMNAMNRLRWANFQGNVTEYPEGKNVPVFRYTPGIMAEMKKKGISKEYIESWQPDNYGDKLDLVADNYAEGGAIAAPSIDTSQLIGMGAEQLAELLSSISTSGSGQLISEIQSGKNPTEAMEKLDRKEVAGGIFKSVGKGAAMGAAGGAAFAGVGAIPGAIGGAIVGLGTGIGKAVAGSGDRKDARNDISENWYGQSVASNSRALSASGYAKGGEIKGKGSGKSDDVPMRAPEGAFIVPTENSAKAMEYGKDYLGWKDNEVAQRNYGQIDINTSNGEVYFTPEEYDSLSYYGVNVDALAPDAEKNKTGFAWGGKTKKGYQEGGTIADLEQQNKEALDRDVNDPLNAFIANSMADIDTSVQAETFQSAKKVPLPEKRTLDDYLKNIGAIAGVAQMAGGTAGLLATGKRPDINVSTTLKSISRKAREEAGYGLPPAVKNALKKDQARSYQKAIGEISSKGGSAQDMHNQMMSALSTRLAAGEKTELADYGAKEEKIKRSQGIDMQLAGQEFDVTKIGLASWERDQDVWANLISAGIENTIGASQYNKQLKWMEENADRGTTFTV